MLIHEMREKIRSECGPTTVYGPGTFQEMFPDSPYHNGHFVGEAQLALKYNAAVAASKGGGGVFSPLSLTRTGGGYFDGSGNDDHLFPPSAPAPPHGYGGRFGGGTQAKAAPPASVCVPAAPDSPTPNVPTQTQSMSVVINGTLSEKAPTVNAPINVAINSSPPGTAPKAKRQASNWNKFCAYHKDYAKQNGLPKRTQAQNKAEWAAMSEEQKAASLKTYLQESNEVLSFKKSG